MYLWIVDGTNAAPLVRRFIECSPSAADLDLDSLRLFSIGGSGWISLGDTNSITFTPFGEFPLWEGDFDTFSSNPHGTTDQ